MTPATLRRQLATGALDPVYLVLGDDDHQKAELADGFEAIVDGDLRVFNVDRCHGAEASLGAVLDAARTLPMMAPRRIVIVAHAELLLQPRRESQASTRDLEALEAYLAAPVPSTALVLVSGRLDERRRIAKRLLARATVVQCGTLEDVDDAKRWIRARMTAAGVSAAAPAVTLLAETVGPDAARLRGEVDRLLLFAAGQPAISEADVRTVVGPAAAHDDWAVARAIERGAAGPALRELALVLEGGAVPHAVLGQLAWVARTRLPAARAERAMDAIFRADLALKRSAGEPRVVLERLVVQLCGRGSRERGGRRGTA